jgi:hypothetical protein
MPHFCAEVRPARDRRVSNTDGHDQSIFETPIIFVASRMSYSIAAALARIANALSEGPADVRRSNLLRNRSNDIAAEVGVLRFQDSPKAIMELCVAQEGACLPN